MEMIGMETNLVPLDFSQDFDHFSKSIHKSVEKNVFCTHEFLEILEKTKEWQLIDEGTRNIISSALNEKSIQKIFQISALTYTVGGIATWTVLGTGITELVPKFFDHTLSLQDITSTTALLYYAKLFASALAPYIIWRKDKVQNKIGKSLSNAVPGVGAWIFPVWALWDEKEFFKFWKIYQKTKKLHRNSIGESSSNGAKEKFQQELTEQCQQSFLKK
jgi:hypothetical protein